MTTTGLGGATLWGLIRSVRLEAPRVEFGSMDSKHPPNVTKHMRSRTNALSDPFGFGVIDVGVENEVAIRGGIG